MKYQSKPKKIVIEIYETETGIVTIEASGLENMRKTESEKVMNKMIAALTKKPYTEVIEPGRLH